MKESVAILQAFLQNEYINRHEMGSPDMSTAIRDCLTDMLHLGDEVGVNIDVALESAKEPYEAEFTEELSDKTGVVG